MNYTVNQSKIRTIRPGDPEFVIVDNLTLSPRASFEISKSCPAEYRSILITAINAKWIKPVANVTEKELLFIGLTR